ncbi:hypothetical protein [Terrihabitans sp. B22-R8]|uniref:hypothetical protein n=1 Tax=Terrihabitans sp. B22-R8 TaxID=3425128 RepID=UPI00403C2389
MTNPTKTPTSHGQTGDSPANPVPEHESYGGRDEVGGGAAGRGNDTGSTVDTGKEWAAGEEPTRDEDRPVYKKEETKNPFSP